MSWRILNIVDRLDPTNMGIWNAALATAGDLARQFGVASELIAPAGDWVNPGYELERVHLLTSTTARELQELWNSQQWDPRNTIVATHGCWQFPTQWGRWLQRRGFPWVYSPQGMLEPWSLRQKRWRKWAYWRLRELPAARHCNLIRGVGAPECQQLRRLFPATARLELIPNGIPPLRLDLSRKSRQTIRFLFLGRLHAKKGVVELARGFATSRLANRAEYELVVAGPDEGQAAEVERVWAETGCRNARWVGPQFGAAKTQLLSESSFFVLPSHSEGFPTAVVEALGYGCIPVISPGCNFPEAQEAGLAIATAPEVDAIVAALEQAAQLAERDLSERQQQCHAFVTAHYTTPQIAKLQFQHYGSLINHAS